MELGGQMFYIFDSRTFILIRKKEVKNKLKLFSAILIIRKHNNEVNEVTSLLST
jgi:hypothetical protein